MHELTRMLAHVPKMGITLSFFASPEHQSRSLEVTRHASPGFGREISLAGWSAARTRACVIDTHQAEGNLGYRNLETRDEDHIDGCSMSSPTKACSNLHFMEKERKPELKSAVTEFLV